AWGRGGEARPEHPGKVPHHRHQRPEGEGHGREECTQLQHETLSWSGWRRVIVEVVRLPGRCPGSLTTSATPFGRRPTLQPSPAGFSTSMSGKTRCVAAWNWRHAVFWTISKVTSGIRSALVPIPPTQPVAVATNPYHGLLSTGFRRGCGRRFQGQALGGRRGL